MTLHVYEELEQRSEAWHEARRGIVTASAVSVLVTPTLKVADNDTSRSFVAALAAERITGSTDPTYVNDDMMRGILHEPVARQKYAEHHKVSVQEVGFAVRDDWGFPFGASPDGLVGDDGGLEVKCPRAKTHIRTIVLDEVPKNHMAQLQGSMLVFGRDWWDFVSFCAGLPMFTKRVYADPAWQEAIVAAVGAAEAAVAALTDEYLTKAATLPATEPIDDEIRVAS